MKKYKMEFTSINILRVILIILLFVIINILKYFMYMIEINYPSVTAFADDPVFRKIVEAFLFITVIICIGYVVIYLPLCCSRCLFCVSDDQISVHKGLFIKSSQYMKIKSILFVNMVTVPFLSAVGFNFLVFNGYGGRILFTFISQKDSDEILAFVKEKNSQLKADRGDKL